MRKLLSCILMAFMILVSVPIYAEDNYVSSEEQTEIELSAHIESTYTISLPKQVDVTNPETTFNIKAKGDIAGDETINIDIPDSATLSEEGSSRSLPLSINDNGGISYIYTDMNQNDYEGTNATRDVIITHDPITAGTWKTNITINISLDEIVMKEAYLSERSVLDQKLPNYANATSIIFDTDPVPSDKLASAVLVSTPDSPKELYAYYTDNEQKSLVFAPKDENTVIYAPTNSSKVFSSLRSLEQIEFDNFDTSKVTNMNGMFYWCALTNLDLSNFNTSNVTDMSDMFYHCDTLTSLILSNWNTAKVTDMSSTFYHCEALTSLDLSNWNTSKVTDMNRMFYGCEALTLLDLSNFDTSKVTDMNYIFMCCYALTSFTVGNNFTMDNVDSYSMYLSSAGRDVPNYDISNVYSSNGTAYSRSDKLKLPNGANTYYTYIR